MKSLVFKSLAMLILIPALYVGSVLFYVWWTDFIPQQIEKLELKSKHVADVIQTDTLSFLNWNIGYAGLGKESDFFYDGGQSVTMPKDIIRKNFNGIVNTLSDFKDSIDFFLLQEIDIESKRTHWMNQFEKISTTLQDFTPSFGKNYDVNFIPIPFTEPLGKVKSGIASWSKFKMEESIRYAFEGNYNFPSYLFFLDRCFMLKRYKTKSGKNLVVVNTHNSAYDDGSLKKKQMDQMKSILIDEYEQGNYVVVGGDWNQNPHGYSLGFKEGIPIPENYPSEGWKCSFDRNTPTCRNLNEPYDMCTTKTGLIDFYIVSPNIDVIDVTTIDQQFEYSDHHPVVMKAYLN